MNRAEKIIATAAKEALKRHPDVAGASPHNDALTRACRATFQLGWLEVDIRKLSAELDALNNPTAKALGVDGEFSTTVGDSEATAYYEVSRPDPEVGFEGSVTLNAVFICGADVTDDLSPKAILRLTSEAYEKTSEAEIDRRAEAAEYRDQQRKDDALEARL